MKLPFEIIDFYFDKLCELSSSGEDFLTTWRAYLHGCGWTEDAYEEELTRRIGLQILSSQN
jgi:hypothetical protein